VCVDYFYKRLSEFLTGHMMSDQVIEQTTLIFMYSVAKDIT